MKRVFFTVELIDGTEHHGRVLAADKIRMEAVARARGWELVEGPRLQAALVWAALHRLGRTEHDLEAFIETELADFELTNDEDDAETEADPT